MNILVINYEYPPVGSGGGAACQCVCEAIADAGHRVDVVTSGMKDLPSHELRNGVNVYRHGCVRRYRHYANTFELLSGIVPAVRAALQRCNEVRYDLIHCHFVVPSGLATWMVARQTGLPYIITAHGSDVPGYNPDRFDLVHRLIRPMWRTILGGAEVINTPSQFLRDLLHTHADVAVEVIPYGFTPPKHPRVPRQNRILVVTRMFERKGVQHLVEAMRGWDTGWELCIAGDGPYLPTLKEITQRAGVEANFVGYVRGQELVDLYHSAKVFVLPSLSENFPVVLLEALAAGCAIVTTAGTGCAEVVGDAAILVEPQNPAAIRGALETLLKDEREIERLRALALARVTRFNPDRIGDEFERLYRRHAQPEPIGDLVAP